MIKDKSYSAYILPVFNNRIALLKYGENGYGPIGGRVDDGEDFKSALRRELTEELGEQSLKMLTLMTEIPVSYSFRHPTKERAKKRDAWTEEHHFFITHETNDFDFQFCEQRTENISVVWLKLSDLINPAITQIDTMRDFFAKHILPNIDCKFSMSVRHNYFEMIKSGQKDIELRAYDEKRKKIQIGDKFLLFDAEESTKYIICEVLNMHIAPDFESLFKNIDIRRSGFANLDELINTVTKFVSYENLTSTPVIGIEIKPVI